MTNGPPLVAGGMRPTYQHGHNPFAEKSPFQRGQYFLKGARKRLNAVAIVIALFLPWGLFCSSMAILDFKMHYSQPMASYLLFCIPLVVCLGLAAVAAKSVKDKETNSSYEPNWYIFLAATSIIALIMGSLSGQANFTANFESYYDLENMGTYTGIDTTRKSGQQLMDAGRITFVNETQLFLGKSMGFKNKDIYCVAPIVPPTVLADATEMKSWDFWAVGKNCCSGTMADFHCPLFSSPEATGGLRVMEDSDRAYYRLAVQQAEATYKIKAGHPLFFYWSRDPIESTKDYLRLGYRNFFMCICCHFVIQAFLVAVATLAFSKLVHY